MLKVFKMLGRFVKEHPLGILFWSIAGSAIVALTFTIFDDEIKKLKKYINPPVEISSPAVKAPADQSVTVTESQKITPSVNITSPKMGDSVDHLVDVVGSHKNVLKRGAGLHIWIYVKPGKSRNYFHRVDLPRSDGIWEIVNVRVGAKKQVTGGQFELVAFAADTSLNKAIVDFNKKYGTSPEVPEKVMAEIMAKVDNEAKALSPNVVVKRKK